MAKKRHHDHYSMNDDSMRSDMIKSSSKVDYMDDTSGMMDPRRRFENMGYDMIKEDPNCIANLPQNVMMKTYPRTRGFMPILGEEDHALEMQLDRDEMESHDQISPRKA